MRILRILSLVNDIPPMLGDLGFPYVDVMQNHREMLEALKVPEITMLDLLDFNTGVLEHAAREHQRASRPQGE